MSPEFYRLLHMGGLLLLFLGLGGIFATCGREGAKPPKLFLAMHGIGLVVMVVSGIGRAHKLGYGWPTWMIAKIGCWVVIAALPTLVRRGMLPRLLAVVLAVALGCTAAWLASTPKPF